jgi:uncharacterized protein
LILLDASGLLAALNSRDPDHARAAAALAQARAPRLLSPFVLAEVDYLLGTKVGVDAELAFLRDVARGAYTLAPFDATDVLHARAEVEKYRDLQIGLADASIVVLSRRYKVVELLSLDERHFRAIRIDEDHCFDLLPGR